MIEKYKVLQPISLCFLTQRDQVDVYIKPGNTIFVDKSKWSNGESFYWQEQESITCVHPQLEIWIENNKIEKVLNSDYK